MEAPMSTKIAVNLPVKDLAAAARFFAELGLPSDKKLANENVEAFVISDDIYVLLVDQSQFKTITKKEIPDTAATSEAILQLQVDSRQRVDELAGKAFAAGALPANEPNDQGFLYGRSFRDLDGHHWDVFSTGPATPKEQT
jgi:predicted lactoylglutathione lyase